MRIKYDYDRVIFTEGLEKDFHHYCYVHKKIKSKRRLARNFLLSRGYTSKDFLSATLISKNLDETIRISKVRWLGVDFDI